MSVKKALLVFCGWLSIALGVLGIVLPLLPTTPFVLLAAVCFSKSSPRFHQWLWHHKVFGPMVQDWEKHGVIKPTAKRNATLGIVLVGGLSLYLVNMPKIAVASLLVIFVCVLIFIWTRPSSPNNRKTNNKNKAQD